MIDWSAIPKDGVTVLGGGVCGITAATLLQQSGFQTCIVSNQLPDDLGFKRLDPLFGSLYPPASVIPYDSYLPALEQEFCQSQELFFRLADSNVPQVRKQWHYFLSETVTEEPAFVDLLCNYEVISPDTPMSGEIPRRDTSVDLYGWRFTMAFVEMRSYLESLYWSYQKLGGRVVQHEISREDLKSIPGKLVINCLGAGAISVFDSLTEPRFTRGHLLHVRKGSELSARISTPLSYSYLLADPMRGTAEAYFYPRENDWVFGGSREEGTITQSGDWISDIEYTDYVEIQGEFVPKHVIEVNSDIIQNLYEVDLRSLEREIHIGYRFDLASNLREPLVAKSDELGRPLIHCLGFGPSGLALSWGAALKVLKLVIDDFDRSGFQSPEVRSKFDQVVSDWLREHLP